jgi:peptidyl-prolyl cis-trans isomerase C
LTKHLAFALTVLALLGCGQTPAASGSAAAESAKPAADAPAAQATPQPPKPVPAELPDPVARINGETIGRAEFERAIHTIEGRAGGPVPAERRDEVFRGVLDQMVSVKLLAQESAAQKIVVADTDVQARLDQIQKQFPNEQAFTQALAGQQITLDKLKTDIRSDLAVNKLLEQAVGGKIPAVTDADAKTFYDQNLDKFKQQEAVRASHILIRVAPDADETAKKKARAEAEDVLKQIKAGGDFAALAREHSQDGSAAQGGDLDFFTRGQMVPAFEQAAFALKPGEVSGIVETQFGLHIIKVTDRRPERTVPFTEVSGQIKDYLSQQKREEATKAYIESLKSKGKVEILF